MHLLHKFPAFCALCLAVAALFPAARAQSCSGDEIQKSANEAKSVRERLLATKMEEFPSMLVFPATQKEILAFKNALANTVTAYLRCKVEPAVNLKTMETELLSAWVNQPEPGRTPPEDNDTDGRYGRDLEITANHPGTEPQLLAVTITFGIPCGEDSMLLIYEHQAGKWQQAVRWQSQDYSQISDSFGDFFQFVVLPTNQPGQWVVATAHGTSWCSSRWSAFALDLVQPKRDGSPQRTLEHIEDGYVRFEKEVIFKYRPDGFEFRVEKGMRDMDIMTRTGIFRFRLVNDRLERLQPIAMNGRDFVDEWLQVKWSDAQRWSNLSSLASLEKEHSRLLSLYNGAKTSLFTYGPVRACSDDPKHFQVELDLTPGSPNYFQIEQGENSFTMLSASTQQDIRCKGPDLMNKR